MPEYRRHWMAGGTFFFTLVTYERQPWLCEPWALAALRRAIVSVRRRHAFVIDAWLVLPDHLHCIWTLPRQDRDYATRWRLIKMLVSKSCGSRLLNQNLPVSRSRRRECGVWQRRYWEHTIRDERDFSAHSDYIHYNPVRHGLCSAPGDWQHSTFQRWVALGWYPPDWGRVVVPVVGDEIGRE